MKKLLLIFAFILASTVTYAQDKHEIRIYPGAEQIGFRSNHFAANLGLEYFILDNISIVPSYSHSLFLGRSKYQTLNLDSRFYMTKGTYQWYGFTGITNNRGRLWGEECIVLTNFVGANLGFGAVIKLSDRFGVNPEIKHQVMREGRTVARLGLVFMLN
jgi:hypothetical protein